MRIRKVGQSSSGNTDRYANQPTLAPKHNYFSNGHFLIDQVNEGTAYTVNTTNVACMDGVRASVVGAGVFTVERAVHPDNAATKCCKISCTTADASIAAGDVANLLLHIPGNECLDLRLGTAEAESLSIQFKFKTNVLGIYGISITNSATDRFYATTINVESTEDTPYTIPVPMDITGTWLYTSGIGFTVRITLAAGSTYQGTLNTWSANNIRTSSAQANFLSANTNVCYISELQMVRGTVVGEMPVADYNADLARCQRRKWKSFPDETAVAQNAGADGAVRLILTTAGAANNYFQDIELPVMMPEGAGTYTTYNPSAANAEMRNINTGADLSATTVVTASGRRILINATGDAGGAVGHRCLVHVLIDKSL